MEKSDLDALADVTKRATDIHQILKLTNIKGENYLLEYKLIDLLQIQSLVKKCPKCGNRIKKQKCKCGHVIYQEPTNEEKAMMKRMVDYDSLIRW